VIDCGLWGYPGTGGADKCCVRERGVSTWSAKCVAGIRLEPGGDLWVKFSRNRLMAVVGFVRLLAIESRVCRMEYLAENSTASPWESFACSCQAHDGTTKSPGFKRSARR
jgi:hypothetical protein